MNDSESGAYSSEEAQESARHERERELQARRARVLERHPRIGWLLLALAGSQAYEESRWRGRARGAHRREESAEDPGADRQIEASPLGSEMYGLGHERSEGSEDGIHRGERDG